MCSAEALKYFFTIAPSCFQMCGDNAVYIMHYIDLELAIVKATTLLSGGCCHKVTWIRIKKSIFGQLKIYFYLRKFNLKETNGPYTTTILSVCGLVVIECVLPWLHLRINTYMPCKKDFILGLTSRTPEHEVHDFKKRPTAYDPPHS